MTPEEAKKKVLEKWPEAQAYWTANDIYDTYKIWSAPISSSSAIILGASYPRERKFGPTIQGSEATAWLDAAARLRGEGEKN